MNVATERGDGARPTPQAALDAAQADAATAPTSTLDGASERRRRRAERARDGDRVPATRSRDSCQRRRSSCSRSTARAATPRAGRTTTRPSPTVPAPGTAAAAARTARTSRDGAVDCSSSRGEAGAQKQFDWVTDRRRPRTRATASRGISSGRMPRFGKVLTEEQIDAIVELRARASTRRPTSRATVDDATGRVTCCSPSELTRQDPLVPDDPRRPRRRSPAVGLFCGSVYLLLGDQPRRPARLPRRRSPASSGFMVMLTLLWITTASPLNTLEGPHPAWKVDRGRRPTSPTRRSTEVAQHRGRAPSKVDADRRLANVKAAVDDGARHQGDEPDGERWKPERTSSPSSPTRPTTYVLDDLRDRRQRPAARSNFEFTHNPHVRGRASSASHARAQDGPVRRPAAAARVRHADAANDGYSSSSATSARCGCRRSSRSSARPPVRPRPARAALAGAGRAGGRSGDGEREADAGDASRRRSDHGRRPRIASSLAGLARCVVLALAAHGRRSAARRRGQRARRRRPRVRAARRHGRAIFAASLFYMDRIRRRRGDPTRRRQSALARSGAVVRATATRRPRRRSTSDVGVGVGEAREQRLVAARREVHAAVEQPVEEPRVPRVVGGLRASS